MKSNSLSSSELIRLAEVAQCEQDTVRAFKEEAFCAHGFRTSRSTMFKQIKVFGKWPKQLLAEIGQNLQLTDLEREFATLRHMEKVRGEKQGDKVHWRLW